MSDTIGIVAQPRRPRYPLAVASQEWQCRSRHRADFDYRAVTGVDHVHLHWVHVDADYFMAECGQAARENTLRNESEHADFHRVIPREKDIWRDTSVKSRFFPAVIASFRTCARDLKDRTLRIAKYPALLMLRLRGACTQMFRP